MPPAKSSHGLRDKGPPRAGRGRPDTGIRTHYRRVETAFPPEVYEGIARLADRRQVETGRSVRRADVIRDALVDYLRVHLPESGL